MLHEIVDHITNYGFTSSKKPLKMNKPHVECFLKANFYPRTVLPAILRTEPRGLGSSSVVHPRHSLKNLDERSAVASNRPPPPVLVVLEWGFGTDVPTMNGWTNLQTCSHSAGFRPQTLKQEGRLVQEGLKRDMCSGPDSIMGLRVGGVSAEGNAASFSFSGKSSAASPAPAQ